GYTNCVEDLTAFYTRRRCHRVLETSAGETTTLAQCAIDLGGACDSATECMTLGGCTESTCDACEDAAGCEGGFTCLDGWCRNNRVQCSDERCFRLCDSDDECPGWSHVETTGQALCVGGRCLPRPGAACETEWDCLDVDAMCSGAACTPCESDGECTDGARCMGDACVKSPSDCVDFRCRPRCEQSAECLSGELCTEEGRCTPALCEGPTDLQTACEGWAHWRAMSRCLAVPCPEAESDGRIDRVLPENLADIPFEDDIDDDQ
ncbi:MAG: hypothetical protein QF464_23100, partial [Myxococcota bacterium]|nr:hypothetical protein [Myxococcota bacterium]